MPRATQHCRGTAQGEPGTSSHRAASDYSTVRHLQRTHLDGAAVLLVDGRPVIGLTLRYDRIDNFWYTLMHELAHVSLHLDNGGEDTAFVDDHSLRGVEAAAGDSKEAQADRMAEDALIPPDVWEASSVILNRPYDGVLDLAQKRKVHPAVVAGRVRYELVNYRLLVPVRRYRTGAPAV